MCIGWVQKLLGIRFGETFFSERSKKSDSVRTNMMSHAISSRSMYLNDLLVETLSECLIQRHAFEYWAGVCFIYSTHGAYSMSLIDHIDFLM